MFSNMPVKEGSWISPNKANTSLDFLNKDEISVYYLIRKITEKGYQIFHFEEGDKNFAYLLPEGIDYSCGFENATEEQRRFLNLDGKIFGKTEMLRYKIMKSEDGYSLVVDL